MFDGFFCWLGIILCYFIFIICSFKYVCHLIMISNNDLACFCFLFFLFAFRSLVRGGCVLSILVLAWCGLVGVSFLVLLSPFSVVALFACLSKVVDLCLFAVVVHSSFGLFFARLFIFVFSICGLFCGFQLMLVKYALQRVLLWGGGRAVAGRISRLWCCMCCDVCCLVWFGSLLVCVCVSF